MKVGEPGLGLGSGGRSDESTFRWSWGIGGEAGCAGYGNPGEEDFRMTITQDISEETGILRPSLLISSHDSYLRVRPRQGNKFDAHLSSLWYSCDRFRRVRSTKCGCTFAREVLDLYIKYRGHCTVPLRDILLFAGNLEQKTPIRDSSRVSLRCSFGAAMSSGPFTGRTALQIDGPICRTMSPYIA